MENEEAATRALREAIELTGGAGVLARAIGVSPTFVTLVLNGERSLPLERGIEIEKATHGRVRVERLCPGDRATIEYLGRREALLPTT
jgi:DNA-binding transcriptional regulator YdaS (Cro superfamily)